MDPELDKLRRANLALEAWVRDLLQENRLLRDRLAEGQTGRAEPSRTSMPVEATSFRP